MSCTREDLRGAGRGDAEFDGATGVKLGNFFKRVAHCSEECLSRSALGIAVPREESAVAFCWIDTPFCHVASLGRFVYLGVELPHPARSAIVECRGSVSERPKVQHSKCCVV